MQPPLMCFGTVQIDFLAPTALVPGGGAVYATRGAYSRLQAACTEATSICSHEYAGRIQFYNWQLCHGTDSYDMYLLLYMHASTIGPGPARARAQR